MKPSSPFRWLLVEDDPEWRELIEMAARHGLPAFSSAGTREGALWSLTQRPFHLISIDQNLPDRQGEPTSADNGFALLASIATDHPFMRQVIYTAHGDYELSNKAGLAGAVYKRKAVGTADPNALTPRGYATFIQTLLSGAGSVDPESRTESEPDLGYIIWALSEGRHHLPPFLARHCEDAFRAGDSYTDWSRIGTTLFHLRERAIYLAWAQTVALLGEYGMRDSLRGVFHVASISEVEGHLLKMWRELDNKGILGSWKPYITSMNPGLDPRSQTWQAPGLAFLSDVRALREERNAVQHGAHFSKADFDGLQSAILSLIDALAFWADRPLMADIRTHPDDPRFLKYSKIAGTTNYPVAKILTPRKTLPGTPDMRRLHIYTLHETPAGKGRTADRRLLDLYPLIGFRDTSRRPPIPYLLRPSLPGRMPVRVSLESFEELPGPLDKDAETLLRSKFGYG